MMRPKRKGGRSPTLESPFASAYKLLFGDDAKERLDRLATRLGLDPCAGIFVTLVLVGLRLAQDEPEFKKRARGQPSLRERRITGIDYQRYLYLWKRCRELGEELGKTITDEKGIERAMDDAVPLFSRDLDLLKASVSRGRRVLKKAIQAEAVALRRKCEEFKNRRVWLESVGPDVARMEELKRQILPGLFFLGEHNQEWRELQARLCNPLRHFA
jgi:hypothetical protein